MLTLRCTAKTLKRFRLEPVDDAPVSTGRLGAWYANLLNVGRRRYVLCVSANTLLPVIMPARNEEFPHRFGEHLWTMLRELGIPPDAVEEEVSAADGLVIARTASRHILGVMNSMAHVVHHVHDRGELGDDPVEIALWLGAMLHGPIEAEAPSTATRHRFGLAGRGPAGRSWLRPSGAAVDAVLASSRRSLGDGGSTPPPPAVRLSLRLDDVHPPVRRELWVDERTTLSDLHRIFQVVMGWHDRHLYQFRVAGILFEDPVPEALGADARMYRLENLALQPGDEFVYTYDLGDDWQCRIGLEERRETRALVRPLPYVVAGERAGPPEDVGGPGGFEELVEALADPSHPEHREMRRWAGARYDPEHFDLEATNESLSRLVAEGAIEPER